MSEMDKYRINDDFVDTTNAHTVVSMSLEEWTRLDKTELSKHYPDLFAFDGEKEWSDIVRAPNADDESPESIAEVANAFHGEKHKAVARPFCLGSLVPLGYLQTLSNNGKTEVITAGRYSMKLFGRGFFPPASWGRIHDSTQDTITDGTFTMVRVSRGKLGLATENGQPVILGEGLHIYNSALFQFVKMQDLNVPHINHMSYHIIRVQKGYFAKVRVGQQTKLLASGVHVVDDPVFGYEGQTPVLKEYMQHGTIHIAQVPAGSLGLVLESNSAAFLHEGVHIYDSATLTWKGVQSKSQERISQGTLHRFRVTQGRMACVFMNNEPYIIESSGTYQVDSGSFRFESLVDTTKKNVKLGAKLITTVYAGEVGIRYSSGELEILQPGRHIADDASHVFDSFLSTQQRSIRLKASGQEIFECETKDLVKIGIRADVFFRISDPKRVITEVGIEKVNDLVVETSIATMTNILRSTSLNDIAQSENPSAVSEEEALQGKMQAQALGHTGDKGEELFFDRAHDQFLSKLHDDFKMRYGIEVTNIRIEQFKILDEVLANNIAQQVLNTAETQNALMNLEGQTKIATQEQHRDLEVKRIKANGDAATRQIELDATLKQAEAETQALQVTAEGEAQVTRIKAEGEGQATRIRANATIAEQEAKAQGIKLAAEASVNAADAEAQGITLQAAAESTRATRLSSIPLGEKLALLNVYGDVVKSSNRGVNKVVYVDPSTTQGGNPFGLLTLQSLQGDVK